jgi:hypothetical protein
MQKYLPIESKKWEYKEHFHAIGMTGDYDGHYEVTNGDISLCTSDDPEDITETENTLQRVANALNESGCKFYCDTTTEHKLHIENMELTYKIDDLRDQAQRMADALNTIGNGPFPVTQKELEEWLLKTKSMAREAFLAGELLVIGSIKRSLISLLPLAVSHSTTIILG